MLFFLAGIWIHGDVRVSLGDGVADNVTANYSPLAATLRFGEVELISEPGWCFFEIGTADTVALTVEYPVNYNG